VKTQTIPTAIYAAIDSSNILLALEILDTVKNPQNSIMNSGDFFIYEARPLGKVPNMQLFCIFFTVYINV
jgi:hypothetical protein